MKIQNLEEKLRNEEKNKEALEKRLHGRWSFITKLAKELYEQMPSMVDLLDVSE